jgi:pimeloyl-ACP methyl ester carboxylesterase
VWVSQGPATKTLEADGGRVLAVDVTGDPDGTPVFLLHGTPGSRNGPRPRSSVLYRLGVRLISYDRPGYGRSTRHENRTVADAATDVARIADHLDIARFAIVGRSGGGPHALACAARLTERVTKTAVLVGLAPPDAPGLDWYGGMTADNVLEYSAANRDPSALIERLRWRADRAIDDPDSLLPRLQSDMTEPDKRVVADTAIRRLLRTTYREALRNGPDGWADYLLALRGEWGFALDAIKEPVVIWHGVDDNFSPVSHARWLADQIPRAEIRVQLGTAHFGAVEVLPAILAWLTAWDDRPCASADDAQGGMLERMRIDHPVQVAAFM